MQLRFNSFVSLLEENKYCRKSIKGLREDKPELFSALNNFYKEMEAYHLLELLINKEADIDSKYMIWVKEGNLPLIFEIKEKYSSVECKVFALKTEIPLLRFTEIINATI